MRDLERCPCCQCKLLERQTTGKQLLFLDFPPPTLPSSHTRMWIFTLAARLPVSITRDAVPWATNMQSPDSLSKRESCLVRERRTHFRACVQTVMSIVARRTRIECRWAGRLRPKFLIRTSDSRFYVNERVVGPALA